MNKTFRSLPILAVSLGLTTMLTGCVNIPKNMVTSPKWDCTCDSGGKAGLVVNTEASREVAMREFNSRHPKLALAYAQVKASRSAQDLDSIRLMAFGDAKGSGNTSSEDLLPQVFVESPVISKMVVATYESMVEGKPRQASISRSDTKQLVRMLGENFGVATLGGRGDRKGSAAAEDTKKNAFKYAQAYLFAYFTSTNGFVDRDGTKYVAPEFKGKVENSTVNAMVGILMESIADATLDTPVWFEEKGGKTNWFCKGGAVPTAFVIGAAKAEKVVGEGEKCGVDAQELKVMRYLSGLAGEQSKLLSGMVFRLFGDVNVGFAIEGVFAFGDNDTLAKALDATFETAAKRAVLESTRHLFKCLSYDKDKKQEGFSVEAVDQTTRDRYKANLDELLKLSAHLD